MNEDEIRIETPTADEQPTPEPSALAKEVRAMLAALGVADGPTVAKAFKSARVDRVVGLLDTLVSLGQARQLDDGRFTS